MGYIGEDTTMLLMIDNYDSFTYNLVQYFAELGAEVVVRRNDEVTAEQIATMNPQHIVCPPQRHRRLARPAEPVRRDALPLAGDRACDPAELPGGHRVDRRRRDHRSEEHTPELQSH